MHDVRELKLDVPCKTRIWLSQRVVDEIAEFRKKGDPNGTFWKKVKRYAINGFANYERGHPSPIRHEWEGVYRVGIVGSLFRIYGFYHGEGKSEFIAIDATLKRGMELSTAERQRIDQVVRIKKEGLWRKEKDEHYPRYTQ